MCFDDFTKKIPYTCVYLCLFTYSFFHVQIPFSVWSKVTQYNITSYPTLIFNDMITTANQLFPPLQYALKSPYIYLSWIWFACQISVCYNIKSYNQSSYSRWGFCWWFHIFRTVACKKEITLQRVAVSRGVKIVGY